MNEAANWQKRVQSFLNTCQGEIKKTTEIGKKMLIASKANSSMNEAYEKLGKLALKEIKDGNLKWDHKDVAKIMDEIAKYKTDLENIEQEVQDIKKQCAEDPESSEECAEIKDLETEVKKEKKEGSLESND